MKLTRLQRHMAYMIMLASFEDGKAEYLCHSLERDGIVTIDNRFDFLFSLTELANKRDSDYSWFNKSGDCSYYSNRSIRIKALKKCISETADAWPK